MDFSNLEAVRAERALLDDLCAAARTAVAPFFRAEGLGVENKSADAFDPVTAADRAVEAAIRDILIAKRPDDAILGEEQEDRPGASGRTWVLDPIDGTRAFVSGLVSWGVLVALNVDGEAVLGGLDQPYLRERFVGVRRGPHAGSWLAHGDAPPRPLRTRACAALADATLFTTDPRIFADERETQAYLSVESRTRLSRYGLDCYGYAMVAAGCADLVIESGLAPYDIQALIPIVEGAGGIVTDWSGGPAEPGGRVVAAGDARIHAEALALLRGA